MHTLLSARARTARSSAIRDLLEVVERPGMLSLAGGLPAADCFPVERLAAAAQHALLQPGVLGVPSLQYGPTEGDRGLRGFVGAAAGVSTDSVLVTAGSQQALDLVARAFLDPGDVVVVEQPGYLGAIQALRMSGPTLVGVPVDHDGMGTDQLAERLAAGLRPKLVYTVPNFQNPTGAVMSLERRRALAALADRYGFVIVEDDPYGALVFEGEALPSLRAFTDRVLTLGSTSKVLAPGLRVGWVIAPEAVIRPLVRLKQAADLHTSSLSQAIVLDVLSDESFMTAHVARLREAYAERAQALANALASVMAFDAPRGGLFLWGELPHGLDAGALLRRAVECGVAFVPGSAFLLDDGPSAAIRLSFASLTPEALAEAAGRLLGAIESSHRGEHAPQLVAGE